MNDLRFAFRQLLKNPGFTAVAALTLVLGNWGLFDLFTATNYHVFRPLPIERPEQVVWLWRTNEWG